MRVLKRGVGGGGYQSHFPAHIFLQIPLPSAQIPFPQAEFRKNSSVMYISSLLKIASHKKSYKRFIVYLGNYKQGRKKVKNVWDPTLDQKELFMVTSFGHCYTVKAVQV